MNRRTFWKQVAAYGLSCLAFVPLVRNLRIVRERRTLWEDDIIPSVVTITRNHVHPTAEEVKSIQEACEKASREFKLFLLTPGQIRGEPVRLSPPDKAIRFHA